MGPHGAFGRRTRSSGAQGRLGARSDGGGCRGGGLARRERAHHASPRLPVRARRFQARAFPALSPGCADLGGRSQSGGAHVLPHRARREPARGERASRHAGAFVQGRFAEPSSGSQRKGYGQVCDVSPVDDAPRPSGASPRVAPRCSAGSRACGAISRSGAPRGHGDGARRRRWGDPVLRWTSTASSAARSSLMKRSM